MRSKLSTLESEQLSRVDQLRAAEAEARKERSEADSAVARINAEQKRVADQVAQAELARKAFAEAYPELEAAMKREAEEADSALAQWKGLAAEVARASKEIEDLRAAIARAGSDASAPGIPGGLSFARIAQLTHTDLKALAARKHQATSTPLTRVATTTVGSRSEEPWEIRHTEGRPNGQWCFNQANSDQPGRDVTFEDVRLVPNPENTDFIWFFRGYRIKDFVVQGSRIVGTPVVDMFGDIQHHPLETAYYFSCNGGSLISDSYFCNLGGHAIQGVNRPYPHEQYGADNDFPKAYRAHIVKNCGIIDTEMFARRGSFSITHFDAGSLEFGGEIAIEDSIVASAWPRYRASGDNKWHGVLDANVYGLRNAEGMFVHDTYHLTQDSERTGLRNHPLDRYSIERCIMVRAYNPLREFGLVTCAKDVIIKDSYLHDGGGANIINIGREGIPDWALSDTFYAENVDSNLVVRIQIGPGKRIQFPLHCPGGSISWRRGQEVPTIQQ